MKNYLTIGVIILISYTLIAWPHLTTDSVTLEPKTHYQYLTAGFSSAQLNLSLSPSQALLALPDPYDYRQNKQWRLHDASLYHGKYYLYFSPLPVLSFYLPFKLFTDFYPSDTLCGLFFLFIAFCANGLLLIKINKKYSLFSQTTLTLGALTLAFSSPIPFLLQNLRIWEIAIAFSYCFTSIAIYFLYKFFHENASQKNIFLFALFFSLAIAGRPHFIVAVFPLFLFLYWFTARQWATLLVFLSPIIITIIMLCFYNYLRFESIFEFGQSYQLNGILNPRYVRFFAMDQYYKNIFPGLYYYFFQPWQIQKFFPFVYLSMPSAKLDYYLSPIVGIFFSTPLLFLLPLVAFTFFKKKLRQCPLSCFMLMFFTIPLSILIYLLCLPGVAERYKLDIVPYLILLCIIGVWRVENKYSQIIKILFMITSSIGIMIGIGLSTRLDYFATLHYGAYFITIDLAKLNIFSIFSLICYLNIRPRILSAAKRRKAISVSD